MAWIHLPLGRKPCQTWTRSFWKNMTCYVNLSKAKRGERGWLQRKIRLKRKSFIRKVPVIQPKLRQANNLCIPNPKVSRVSFSTKPWRVQGKITALSKAISNLPALKAKLKTVTVQQNSNHQSRMCHHSCRMPEKRSKGTASRCQFKTCSKIMKAELELKIIQSLQQAY